MWTTPIFTPFAGKGTVGTLSATFNAGLADEFTFTLSVNLDVTDSLEDFYGQAVKGLLEDRRKRDDLKPDSTIAKLLVVIADQLNTRTPADGGK